MSSRPWSVVGAADGDYPAGMRSTVVPTENPQRISSAALALMPRGSSRSRSIGGFCFEMVEHVRWTASVGPAAGREEAYCYLWLVHVEPEGQGRTGRPFIRTDPYPWLWRSTVTHMRALPEIHLESLPAPGGLETRMARSGLARSCTRRWNAANGALSESFESWRSCMRTVERSFNVRDSRLRIAGKRSALLSERDGLPVHALP